eukprot:symbB.v1.2.021038.t1/scaffold1797.1/size100932/5
MRRRKRCLPTWVEAKAEECLTQEDLEGTDAFGVALGFAEGSLSLRWSGTASSCMASRWIFRTPTQHVRPPIRLRQRRQSYSSFWQLRRRIQHAWTAEVSKKIRKVGD